MKKLPSNQGFALLLVLVFIVLMSIMALTFLGEAGNHRPISASSAQMIKNDVFEQGCIDQIIADLKQEIAAGSVVTNIVTSNGTNSVTNTIFYPAGTSQIPSTSGFSSASGLENLLKISQSGSTFFPTNSTNYPGASVYQPSSRASAASSTNASINGRYISLARWNKSLLLTPVSASNYTPVASLSAPSWVLVSRNGQNPSSWTNNLQWSKTNGTTVVGRYAYAIFNEGGLLDVNVAGYPATNSGYISQSANVNSTNISFKGSLACADLSAITGTNNLPILDQANINSFVYWRNRGTLGGTNVSGTNYLNYSKIIQANLTGNLAVSSTNLSSGLTDQLFTSRQQLISFVSSLGNNSYGINPLLALPYLTTFSRGLNQPSYRIATNKMATLPTLGTALGGNNAGGLDSSVNADFLAQRTTSGGWTRNDGSLAILGEPLVKKRFALDRLAWITPNGPIADDSGNLNPNNDATIASIITTLENSYGINAGLLSQGGPTNIYKYFGLIWAADSVSSNHDGLSKWIYDHGSSTYPSSYSPGASASLFTLSQVTGKGREADFFELLKGSISIGSLGKAYHHISETGGAMYNSVAQTTQPQYDNSTDRQIMQIGANIINQASVDSYSRRIVYYDSGTGIAGWNEVMGIVDLPYLYRVREGKVLLHEPIVGPYGASNLPMMTTNLITGANNGVVLQEPEIWNPHAYNPSSKSRILAPTSFRLVASSGSNTVQPNSSWIWYNYQGIATDTSPLASPSIINDQLTFNIPSNAPYLFREPTLLIKPGIPSGSSLAGTTYTCPYDARQYQLNGTTFSGDGASNYHYLGISMGQVHMAFVATVPFDGLMDYSPGGHGVANYPTSASPGVAPVCFVNYDLPGNTWKTHGSMPIVSAGIKYKMQYQDPSNNWITYDYKNFDIVNNTNQEVPNNFVTSFFSPVNGPISTYDQTFFLNTMEGLTASEGIIGSQLSEVCFDPRTGRFGMLPSGNCATGYTFGSFPLGRQLNEFRYCYYANGYGTEYNHGWGAPVNSSSTAFAAAAANNAVQTMRPDVYMGFPLSCRDIYNEDLFETDYINNHLFYYTYPGSGMGWGINSGPCASNGQTLGGWFPVGMNAVYPSAQPYENYGAGTPCIQFPGMMVQNSVSACSNLAAAPSTIIKRYSGDTFGQPMSGTYVNTYSIGNNPYNYTAQFYADADMVVRRGMAGFVPSSGSVPQIAATPGSGQPSGIPTVPIMDYTVSPPCENTNTMEYLSRPVILNRPFKTVAELGYVFSDTPWKNLDMGSPESPTAPLLDVFCIDDAPLANGLVAGKVDLNTKQPTVLTAILSGAYRDVLSPLGNGISTNYISPLTQTNGGGDAAVIGSKMSSRNTSVSIGPIQNLSELVGKWVKSSSISTVFQNGLQGWSAYDGSLSYVGLTSDTINGYDLVSALGSSTPKLYIERFREAAIRALSGSCQTRVWNLMIDVVAQTGRYTPAAGSLDAFTVEGEQRFWIHLSIDRLTGQVLDKQVEAVNQ